MSFFVFLFRDDMYLILVVMNRYAGDPGNLSYCHHRVIDLGNFFRYPFKRRWCFFSGIDLELLQLAR